MYIEFNFYGGTFWKIQFNIFLIHFPYILINFL